MFSFLFLLSLSFPFQRGSVGPVSHRADIASFLVQVNGFAAEHSAIDIEEAIFYERGSVTVSAETDDAEAGSSSVSVAVEQRRYG